MKSFVMADFQNDQTFVVKVNEKDYERAKELAYEGYSRWMNTDDYPEYHDVGYAEPAEELLEKEGIHYEIDNYYIYDDFDWPGPIDLDSFVKPEYKDIEIVEY